MQITGLSKFFRSFICLLVCIGWLLPLSADESVGNDTTLQLVVEGVQRSQGHIIVGVFACEASYDEGENPKMHAMLPAQPRQGKVEYTFRGLPAGSYAIKLFHDINDNQKLDSNWLGIPREPFGFSNNPRIRFGPPDFDTARFTVVAGESHRQLVILN